VTARPAAAEFDFVSRFFAPRSGVDEDPVTGSAHCALGPYWAGRLGKSEFTAYQASARGGVVRVRLRRVEQAGPGLSRPVVLAEARRELASADVTLTP
jgi:predicted PhzF superfamily epimerase YddE/YHI9